VILVVIIVGAVKNISSGDGKPAVVADLRPMAGRLTFGDWVENHGLVFRRVSCRWNGNAVRLHFRVRNTGANRVTLTLSPTYTLASNGSHGGSVFSMTDVSVGKRSRRNVSVNAGIPHNDYGDVIEGHPRITSCTPSVSEAEYATPPPPPLPAMKLGFCDTHTCIPNFPNGNGYIVQCSDGEWSHSGGLSGACSWHGGETDNVYRGSG
jgi:hypothetical protein